MRKPLIALTAVLLPLLAACSGPSEPVQADSAIVVTPAASTQAGTPPVTEAGPAETSASQAPATPQEPAAVEPETCEVAPGQDVVVGAGEACVISDLHVDGNIKVRAGGSLQATGVTVDGDIQGEGHLDVTVIGGAVDGNIQLEDGGTALVTGVTIDGDLQSEGNRGTQDFTRNTIDGNLQCEGNDPAPTGSDNRVAGDAEDQCATLAA